eukprot:4779308-Pyramimonas_sp.AAC.1
MCLLEESTKWAANIEVHLQGQSDRRADNVGLVSDQTAAPDAHEQAPVPEPPDDLWGALGCGVRWGCRAGLGGGLSRLP